MRKHPGWYPSQAGLVSPVSIERLTTADSNGLVMDDVNAEPPSWVLNAGVPLKIAHSFSPDSLQFFQQSLVYLGKQVIAHSVPVPSIFPHSVSSGVCHEETQELGRTVRQKIMKRPTPGSTLQSQHLVPLFHPRIKAIQPRPVKHVRANVSDSIHAELVNTSVEQNVVGRHKYDLIEYTHCCVEVQ
jgi:hypothetical protein